MAGSGATRSGDFGDGTRGNSTRGNPRDTGQEGDRKRRGSMMFKSKLLERFFARRGKIKKPGKKRRKANFLFETRT